MYVIPEMSGAQLIRHPSFYYAINFTPKDITLS